jgi:hypothetical protein
LQHWQTAQACLQRNKKKLKGKEKEKEKEALGPEPEPPVAAQASADELCMKAKSQLCRGQCRMALVAGGLGIGSVTKISHEHSSWHLIFSKRFSAFSAITTPPLPTYAEFLETVKGRLHVGSDGVTSSGTEGAITQMVDEANISYGNVKKYMDFVRKNIADGNKDNCFSDPTILVTAPSVAQLLGAAPQTPALIAGSAADKIAKSYCIATLKVYWLSVCA